MNRGTEYPEGRNPILLPWQPTSHTTPLKTEVVFFRVVGCSGQDVILILCGSVRTWGHQDMKTISTLLTFCEPPLIARFMGPTWGPSGADRTQVVPMLAPWTLLSGHLVVNGQQCGIMFSLLLACKCCWLTSWYAGDWGCHDTYVMSL